MFSSFGAEIRPSVSCHVSLLPLVLLLVLLLPQCVVGTIYLENETFASLPALFGRYMVDHKIYHGRLQYLPENPYLCDRFDSNHTSFVIPPPLIVGSNNLTLPSEPIVLLASRGNCPFARKAAVAESVSKHVEFLIVYNYDLEGDDTLVPMFTEYGDSRLILLSITHRSGHLLRQYLQQQPMYVLRGGGPDIAMDSLPPPGMLTTEDLQQMMLSAIGLFFLLVSFSGCIMIFVGTYGQVQPNGRIVFTAGPAMLRTSLSEAQVLQLPSPDPTNDPTISCAICLDDEMCDAWITLPCQHHFHKSCIVPWLTERQPKCPLCKYDVLQHLLEHPNGTSPPVPSSPSPRPPPVHVRSAPAAAAVAADAAATADPASPASSSTSPSLWTRLTRSRWTQVNTDHDDEDDDADEHETELTEQQQARRTSSASQQLASAAPSSSASSSSSLPLHRIT